MFTRAAVTLLVFFTLVGCAGSPTKAESPTLSPQELQGQKVFKSYCSACHASSGDTVVVGPSLAGIATRGATRIDGMDARQYIMQSLLKPDAYTVEGFPESTMPSDLSDQLSQEDLEALVAYLLILH